MRSAWRGGVSAFWEYARAACLTTQAARLFVRGPGGGGGVGPEAQLHGARPLQADTCAGGGLVYKNTALSLRSRVLRDTMRHVFVMCGSKTFLKDCPPLLRALGRRLAEHVAAHRRGEARPPALRQQHQSVLARRTRWLRCEILLERRVREGRIVSIALGCIGIGPCQIPFAGSVARRFGHAELHR